MISVSTDTAKNRLLFTLKGRPNLEEVEAARHELSRAFARLRPPFDLISDVRELESLDDVGRDVATELLKHVLHSGVRRTVRIVGKSTNGALQIERVARVINHHAFLAFSNEEAEQVLASP